MTKHRFKVGDRASLAATASLKMATSVVITGLYPADHENLPLRYRVKAPSESHERMATEDQLKPG
ncbi:hypothetical protein [Hansschlegelia sp. KR7-227]|jgi:hypothetical protein|uniref:hypothetical protein n=1 Tax=Hansschlegelia sp. KR7-227 TaxID=3400914 RepID=UPI003BFBB8F6